MHFAEGLKQLFRAICILQETLNKAEEGEQKQQLKMSGLAMRRGGAKRQTQAAKPPQGRADLRAPKRSACRRQEAPKL